MHTTRLRQATPPPLKTIEPGRDEGAARVETTGNRKTDLAPNPRQGHHGFDTTHSLTLAGRLNQLQEEQSRLSQHVSEANG